MMLKSAAAAIPFAFVAFSAWATPQQHCVPAEIVLWGDGRHDDTLALNAWLRGKDAIWGEDGAPVGARVAGRSFRLSAAIYVTAGSGRTLEDFRLFWPERGEIVTGGTVSAGDDPDKAPVVAGVSVVGGDPGEGKPFDAPDAAADLKTPPSCATS